MEWNRANKENMLLLQFVCHKLIVCIEYVEYVVGLLLVLYYIQCNKIVMMICTLTHAKEYMLKNIWR